MNPLNKMYQKIKNLPNKKNYLEFVTALLSIPVLLTVVYMNYLSIQEKRTQDALTPTPAPTQTVVTIIRERDSQPEPTAIPNETIISEKECEPGIGKIEITKPTEEVVVSDNPLEVDITYAKGDYCSVVWSYRINGSSWSDYTDNNIVIYNLPSGQKKLELRVKSIVSGETQTIERNFTYKNTSEIPTPTEVPPSLTPTPTASVQGVSDQTSSQ